MNDNEPKVKSEQKCAGWRKAVDHEVEITKHLMGHRVMFRSVLFLGQLLAWGRVRGWANTFLISWRFCPWRMILVILLCASSPTLHYCFLALFFFSLSFSNRVKYWIGLISQISATKTVLLFSQKQSSSLKKGITNNVKKWKIFSRVLDSCPHK